MFTTQPKPLKLESISRLEADRLRTRFRHRDALSLSDRGKFALHIVDAIKIDAKKPDGVIIKAMINDEPVHAIAPRQLVFETIAGLSKELKPEPMSETLLGLMLEVSLLGLLDRWEKHRDISVKIETVFPDLGGGHFVDGEFAFDTLNLMFETAERYWPIRVHATSPLITSILAGWPSGNRNLGFLNAPARLRAGMTTLTVKVLNSLRPGDVVVLETRGSGFEKAMLVVSERLAAPAELDDGAWTLTEAPHRVEQDWMSTMSNDDNDDEEEEFESEEDGGLDDLPVRLAFDLGHIDMPIGELRQLDAGSVLELRRITDELVDITANGRRIGRGELVDIEGTLGVRISRIFDRE